MEYSALKSWTKGLKYFVIFFIATIATNFISSTGFSDFKIIDVILYIMPDGYEGMTIGGFLVVLVNYLKYRWGFKL